MCPHQRRTDSNYVGVQWRGVTDRGLAVSVKIESRVEGLAAELANCLFNSRVNKLFNSVLAVTDCVIFLGQKSARQTCIDVTVLIHRQRYSLFMFSHLRVFCSVLYLNPTSKFHTPEKTCYKCYSLFNTMH